ncbi:MAG: MarC family protein [Alphaproteobacteria bacterium]|nr:MarC family protein [Alphaproteobacteria bacterium]MBQ7285444.1 MarC family protein [Alphaproteobacteria bacterium]
MFKNFDFQQFISAFFVLFAIIDIIGTMPIIISLKKRGKIIHPLRAAILSFAMFMLFLYVGEAFLKLFNVDISSFAVAGSLIIFVMALEMVLDIHIFKDTEDSPKDSTFFPIVFPLIAGAGALTTLLSIRSQFHSINIIFAVAANMVIVYGVLRFAKKIAALLGAGVIYMIQKFFGIILLAISVKLFTTNLTEIIEGFIHRAE